MRRLLACSLTLVLSLGLSLLPARAQPAARPQVIFLGDRTCLDTRTDCPFPGVTADHRYLHVILHDSPGYNEWQVQIAPICSDTMPTVASAQPVASNGYLEIVVDLSTTSPSPVGTSACYVFRGREHWAFTYYAAYFDDSSSPDGDVLYPGYETQLGRPALPDLDVLYIHRSPSYAYDAPKNAPAPGDRVVFTAHIANSGAIPISSFGYLWSLDGREQASGSVTQTLDPGAETTLDLPWTWQPGPHDLTLRLLPLPEEISFTNNTLTVRTDALMLGFWVEKSAWEYFNRYQWTYCSNLPCAGSDSFADWLQREVAAWNRILSSAVFAGFTPAGVTDRVRADEIVVVPDGALPLHGWSATNTPDLMDHTVDLEWGLPASGVTKAYPHQWEGPFDLDWSTIHELGHARSLADLYRFDVGTGPETTIDVVGADGQPIYSSSDPLSAAYPLHAYYDQQNDLLLYHNEAQDLMSCVCTPQYAVYDALIWNRLRGERPTCGNYNAPCNLGDWFLDLPPDNRLRILSASGGTLPDDATVRVFYDEATDYTGHSFQQVDSTLLTLHAGVANLGADPFRVKGSRYLAGHNLLLLEVRSGVDDVFCFVEPTLFNMAYWLGYRTASHPAIFTLRLGEQQLNDCHLHLPPALVNEPFATSPAASHVTLARARPSSGGRTVLVSLRDDARPAHAMRERTVELLDASGRVLGKGITDRNGIISIHVPARASVSRAIDVTDHGLALPVPVGTNR